MLNSHCYNNNEKKNIKRNAVTWTRNHILRIDKPSWDPLRHDPMQITDTIFVHVYVHTGKNPYQVYIGDCP